jgi:Stigma-specific protein, Stig1
MLPGFSASSSLYRSPQMYAGYSTSSVGDAAPMGGIGRVVTSTNGAIEDTCPPDGCAQCVSWGYGHHCCYIQPNSSEDMCYYCGCCEKGETCCVPYQDYGSCEPGCVDLRSDFHNCGSCLKTCNPGEICCDGNCTPQNHGSCGCPAKPCAEGLDCCGSECVDITSNAENCGSCGDGCLSGQPCCGGTCCSGHCCGGQCCSRLEKCVNGKCCVPEADMVLAAILLCILTLGSDCPTLAELQLRYPGRMCPS